MRVTTVALPEQMFLELSHAAIDDGVAMTELVRRVLGEFLDKRRKRAKGDKR